MPELPEVECVRRGLERALVGTRLTSLRIQRPDFIRDPEGLADRLTAALPMRIGEVTRHGKRLAMALEAGGRTPRRAGPASPWRDATTEPRPLQAAVAFHLGMSGRLLLSEGVAEGVPVPVDQPPHTHAVLRFDRGPGSRALTLLHVDPRRFGYLGLYGSLASWRRRDLSGLGPDAMKVTARELYRRLAGRSVAIKAALLDQGTLAGVGNIYADELLFACGVHPLTAAGRIDEARARRMVRAMRGLLRSAIEAGGSTLRDYADTQGLPGTYRDRHRVYGRHGMRCPRCGATLDRLVIAQRTTSCCPRCQPYEPD